MSVPGDSCLLTQRQGNLSIIYLCILSTFSIGNKGSKLKFTGTKLLEAQTTWRGPQITTRAGRWEGSANISFDELIQNLNSAFSDINSRGGPLRPVRSRVLLIIPSRSSSSKMESSSICLSFVRRAIIDRGILPPQDSGSYKILSRWLVICINEIPHWKCYMHIYYDKLSDELYWIMI